MPLLFRRRSAPPNIVSVRSGWPVRLSEITLKQDLAAGEKSYPEIFFVTAGNVLHTSPSGRQSLRPGSVVVAHAGSSHHFSAPVNTQLLCLSFLPEWLAGQFPLILRSPDLFSLIFAHCWLDFPSREKVLVFSLPDHRFRTLNADLAFIRNESPHNRHAEPLLEVTFLKMLLELAHEFGNFWRHQNRIHLREEILLALSAVESAISHGDPLRLKSIEPAVGMSIDHFGRSFKKSTGSTLVDYAQKRRAHHAAHLLLADPSLKATTIAKRLGFTDSAHLAKSFQKIFSHTPNSYRETFGSPAPSHSRTSTSKKSSAPATP